MRRWLPVLVVLLMAAPVEATSITWTLTGTLTNNSTKARSVLPGSDFTMTWTFDADAVDLDPLDHGGYYTGHYIETLVIGEWRTRAEGDGSTVVVYLPATADTGGYYQYAMRVTMPDAVDVQLTLGARTEAGSQVAPLTSDALLATPPDMSTLSTSDTFALYLPIYGGALVLQPTAITAVPEPSAALLLLLGLPFALHRRRHES